MLEHETDSILETLRERTIGAREAILLREILAADIPRGIKTYMQAETVRALESELFSSPRFSRVDRQESGVRRHGRAFIATMSALYSYPREEYLSLLENAIHFLENYLCRPQWTIEHFVFESGGRMSAQDVVAKLDCTVDYAYFRTLIQKIMQHRRTSDISAEEFHTMLIRIDDQIVKQHNARELALLAKPIFDFLLLRDTPPDVSIPLKPILVFFEDKKMNILRDYIESICRIRRRTDITLDELTTLVEDLYLGQAVPAPPPPPTPAQMEPQTVDTAESDTSAEVKPGASDEGPSDGPAQNADAASPPLESGEGETPESEPPAPADQFQGYEPTIEIQVPSIFDFVTEEPDGRDDGPLPDEPPPQRNPPSPREEIAPRPAGDAPQNPQTEKPRIPEAYERLFKAPEPPAGLTDLRELIQGHTRSRFVKRLFDRNEDKYEDVISSLNNSGTWRDASLLLNTLYMANGLDPFDPDVVEFTDAIHRRYMDAEKDGA
jgi:hypothetical protein